MSLYDLLSWKVILPLRSWTRHYVSALLYTSIYFGEIPTLAFATRILLKV